MGGNYGDFGQGAGNQPQVSLWNNDTSVKWSDNFSISSKGDDDQVVINHGVNSQYTSLEVNVGDGNDTVDLSALDADASLQNVTRTVDGGNGLDTLIISNQTDLTFSNFEVVTAKSDDSSPVALAITSELMAENSASDHALVVHGFDVDLDGFDSVSLTSLDASDASYLTSLGLDSSDYSSLMVEHDDTSYHLLTDDSDIAALA